MQVTERQKWDEKHKIGALLAGVYAKTEPGRRCEFNDSMLAGAWRSDAVASWVHHLCERFKVRLEELWIDGQVWPDSPQRADEIIASVDWTVLRAAIKENPGLLTMIARNGPLDPKYAPVPDDPGREAPKWIMPVPTGKMIPVPSLRSIWTNQSDMTHGADARYGNVVLFRREPTVDLLTGQMFDAPMLSGNSIRHSWRILAADGLYLLVGLDKAEVDPELHHALTSGGTIDAGSEMAKVDPALRAAVRFLCPAFELLGGIVEKQVCHGAWNVHDAILVCRENATRLMDPSLYPPPSGTEDLARAMEDATGVAARRETRVKYASMLHEYLRPSYSYLQLRQYTTHRDPDVEMKGDDDKDPKKHGKRHMLWDTEVMLSNAQWVHHCRIHNTATDFARSCVGWIFKEFEDYPYLAAASGKGHGLISFDGYHPADDSQELKTSELFLGHIEENKGTILEWLRSGKVPVSLRTPPPLEAAGEEGKQKPRGRSRKAA